MGKIIDGKKISEQMKEELKDKVEKLKAQGKKVIIGACDTFRAAAGEQLTECFIGLCK